MQLNFEIPVRKLIEKFNNKNSFFSGEFGFLLPDTQIVPSGQETLAGELALLKYIEQNVYA